MTEHGRVELDLQKVCPQNNASKKQNHLYVLIHI